MGIQVNLETLYGAVDDGAVKLALPRFVRKELVGCLDCGVPCRGFARLRCDGGAGTRLVAFACKGRGFCPSCLRRKMSATAANLVDDVQPTFALRQWVLKVPFAWRSRRVKGQSGAVLVGQRTSSDPRLNSHVHAVFLDGAFEEPAIEAAAAATHVARWRRAVERTRSRV